MRFTGGESELGLEEWVKVGQVKKDGKSILQRALHGQRHRGVNQQGMCEALYPFLSSSIHGYYSF